MNKHINQDGLRRKKGAGSVYQIKSDLWRSKITKNGTPFQFYGETEREAEKKLDDFISKFSQGAISQKRMSYDTHLTEWLGKKKLKLKPQSYDRLEFTVEKHLIPTLGYYDLDKVDDKAIQSDLIDEKVKTNSYSSVKKMYDAVNASMKYAQKQKRIIHNPVDLVELPASTSKQFKKKKSKANNIEIFTDSEIKKFVEAANAKFSNSIPVYRNAEIFLLMLNTGMRVSEAAALKWCDYCKDSKTIRVFTTLIQTKDENGKYIVEEQDSVKTKNSERVLKLNPKAIEAIETIKENNNSDFIFCAKNGNPLRPRNIQNKLDAILNRAGIKHKSTHVFRHTYASKLFAKGIDVKIVSDLLGHADVRTTYNTYIKLIKQQKAQAMDSIELY